jgi:hypothetical protein
MTRILGATCAALAAVCLYFAHIADVQREEAMALKEQLVQQRASALHLSALVAAGTTTPASFGQKRNCLGQPNPRQCAHRRRLLVVRGH